MNHYRPEGTAVLTAENREAISSLEGLERALETGAILEAPAVLADAGFNLHVSLGPNLHGVMARDEVQFCPEDESVKDIAILTRVGKPVCFKVIGFRKEGGKTTVHLSRREAQRECMESYVAGLLPGDVIPARITHLENFGAFADIGCGVISLLPIDCISVSRIHHPSARLSVGDNLFTVVRSIDERGRIYISLRELLGTWEENAARFEEGQTVRGTVRSVEPYGIFVELLPNLSGLAEFKENVRPGQSAAVYIKSLIPEKMKVKRILIDATDDVPPPEKLSYFVDTSSTFHMDSWQYSPVDCEKRIGTVFE
ncbi:MAG: S1 RNA-binding domain-containing protein [Clostridia bacterium]|nr:S1 RNA-binding domain-containing protein [Clostridia bacterium]